MIRAGLAALLILALAAPAALADVRIDGHGWGHGVGMSQYGAMGYAGREGRDFRWILGHYYPGTTLESLGSGRVRVRLKEAVALKLLGKAENGVTDGRYRGALMLSLDAANVLGVDDAGLEDYLLGVVGSEMPASWPAQALDAQAVAARSYALTHRTPAAPFDVFADTRSQVYRGLAGEAPATTAAVNATRRLAVVFGGRVAETLFHSSSGGRTAAVEEVFTGSAPIPYLISVDDPYDTLSRYHDWTVTMSVADTQKQLGLLVPGTLTGLSVSAATPTGRASTVHITGTLGQVDVDAGKVQQLLGLRSTWFTIAFG